MLVTTEGPYENFRYRAEVKINEGGNSGLYFRTTARAGFMDGYEAQINSNHTDPILTGSLYGMCHVYHQLVKPDTWFIYEVEVTNSEWRGRKMVRIKFTVDGKELYEYLDFAETFKERTPDAYERLLMDVVQGDPTLFMRRDEVEAKLLRPSA